MSEKQVLLHKIHSNTERYMYMRWTHTHINTHSSSTSLFSTITGVLPATALLIKILARHIKQGTGWKLNCAVLEKLHWEAGVGGGRRGKRGYVCRCPGENVIAVTWSIYKKSALAKKMMSIQLKKGHSRLIHLLSNLVCSFEATKASWKRSMCP